MEIVDSWVLGVLKNFANFTGKHLHCSLFLVKFQVRSPTTLLKETLTEVFLCEICKFVRTPFLQDTFSGYSSEEKVFSKKKTF